MEEAEPTKYDMFDLAHEAAQVRGLSHEQEVELYHRLVGRLATHQGVEPSQE